MTSCETAVTYPVSVVIVGQLRRLDMPASHQQNISYCTTFIISMETSEISHLKLYMYFFCQDGIIHVWIERYRC